MKKSKRKNDARKKLEEVADHLHSVAIHLLRRVRKQDIASGEGPARLSALSVLVFGGPMTLGQLAAAEQVKPPTITRIVKGLERSGWVRRVIDRQDARRATIHATEAGIRLLQHGRQLRTTYLAQHLEVLSETDLAILSKAVAVLERVLQQWS